jgi:hypothetical protein
VINRTLLERHGLLKEVVIPAPPEGHPVSAAMTGRMVALLPGVPLLSGVPGSKLSQSLEDIQEKFEESLRINVSPLKGMISCTASSGAVACDASAALYIGSHLFPFCFASTVAVRCHRVE